MAARPVSARVSAYMASTSATMRPLSAAKSWDWVSSMRTKPSRAASKRRSSFPLVLLDERVGAVVVDRLEVLRLDHVGNDALVEVQHGGDVADHVLDELRIVVGALGDVLLVGTLEQAVELARGLSLDDLDDFLDPDEVVGMRGDRHVRALVVRAALGDLLRARAETGDRHDHLHGEARLAPPVLAGEGHFVVHQAPDARDRRLLLDEV